MLHTDSMILASGMCAALMATTFLAMRRIPGMPRSGLLWWGLGNAQLALASLLLVNQATLGLAFGIGLASSLFMCGMAMLVVGTRQFAGRSHYQRVIGLTAAFTILGFLYFTLVSPQVLMRIAIISWFTALTFADLLCLCAPYIRERALRFPAFIVSATALLGMALHVLRTAHAGWTMTGASSWIDPAVLMHVVRIFNAFAITALPLGFLMLAHARLRTSLERQITHDSLTGVLSRAGFMGACDAMLKRADRQQRPVCLAFIDLDHFKTINDVYGHLGGDRVLEHFAASASRSLGNEHALGRLGGEEFALLYYNMALEDARLHSYRLRADIERQGCPSDEHWIMYTVSVGLVERQPGESLASLLKRADAALYSAKASGRNAL